MLGLMTNAITGAHRGVHRTALLSDGSNKAVMVDGGLPKRMLGPAKDAVVRLSADEDVTTRIGIAEGIETALATGFAPIWACLSAGTMERFPVLSGIEALTIFADNDASGTGLDAAWKCAERWHGWAVR